MSWQYFFLKKTRDLKILGKKQNAKEAYTEELENNK